MTIQRAISYCPRCNTSEEIWFHNSVVVPKDEKPCIGCKQVFVTSNFVISLLDLRSNTTPSAIELAKIITHPLLTTI